MLPQCLRTLRAVDFLLKCLANSVGTVGAENIPTDYSYGFSAREN
jgi:hypothetical protein